MISFLLFFSSDFFHIRAIAPKNKAKPINPNEPDIALKNDATTSAKIVKNTFENVLIMILFCVDLLIHLYYSSSL